MLISATSSGARLVTLSTISLLIHSFVKFGEVFLILTFFSLCLVSLVGASHSLGSTRIGLEATLKRGVLRRLARRAADGDLLAARGRPRRHGRRGSRPHGVEAHGRPLAGNEHGRRLHFARGPETQVLGGGAHHARLGKTDVQVPNLGIQLFYLIVIFLSYCPNMLFFFYSQTLDSLFESFIFRL